MSSGMQVKFSAQEQQLWCLLLVAFHYKEKGPYSVLKNINLNAYNLVPQKDILVMLKITGISPQIWQEDLHIDYKPSRLDKKWNACVLMVCFLVGECRIQYANEGLGKVSQELYETLTSIQMGKSNDFMGWTMKIWNLPFCRCKEMPMLYLVQLHYCLSYLYLKLLNKNF